MDRGILIVDDAQLNREILSDMLSDEYNIFEAESGEKAVSILERKAADIHLVLLDLNMPGMDGFEVLRRMEKSGLLELIPVIVISAEQANETIERAYEMGVSDYISRPFDMVVVRRRVANTIALYEKQRKLEDMVIDQLYKNERDNRLMILILSHIVEFRNGESGSHILHIHVLTKLLLERLNEVSDKYNLTSSEINLISIASALHDIGKITIPSSILNKPGRLTSEEFDIMKQHALRGAEMLKSLEMYQSERLVEISYNICRWHHERYDGSGYPDGLVGDDIPIEAQVVAIADVYDALTSVRCYKLAVPHDMAMQMIIRGECGAFNPLILKCLEDIAPYVPERLEQNEILKRDDMDIKALAESVLSEAHIKTVRTIH